MSKRLVRIYKDPKGQGDYVNKTKAFLKKAQMGAEVQPAPDVNQYMQYIYKQLRNDATLDDVFAELVATGIKQDVAYQMLTNVVSAMVENGEMNPDNPITKNQQAEEIKAEEEAAKQKQQEQQPQEEQQQEEEPDQATDYFNSYADEPEYSQPDLEFEGGGEYEEDEETAPTEQQGTINQYDDQNSNEENIENNTDDNQYGFLKQPSQYPGLEDYYQGFTPLEWNPQDMSDFNTSFKKGGSKKSFVKNILKKLQEGGQEKEQSIGIGQGNKFDNFTEEVSKIKQNFIETLKTKANKARLDETYDKMMNSGNPDLIETANTIAQNRNNSEEEQESFFQSGGYVGEAQPEMFMYGGTEMPFYEADFLPEAQEGNEVRTAKVKYVPNRVLPANTKFRLFNPAFGEKKTYTGSPYNPLTREIYRDPVDDLTPVARTVHKRGIFGRPKKWTDYYQKGPSKVDQDFINNFTEYKPKKEDKKTKDKKDDGKNKWGFTEDEWDEMSGKERRLERRGHRRLNRQMARGEKFLAEQKLSPAQEFFLKKQKEEEAKRNNELAEAEKINSAELQKEREAMLPAIELQKQAMDRLKAYTADNSADIELAKIRDNAYNQFASLRDFKPDKKAFEKYQLKYKPLEDAYNKEKEGRELEEEMQNQEYEKRYGGLPKAQVGVKSPTSGVSTASDPTANTMNLMDVLKPQENPNTFMGASAPWMNQNIPTNTEAPKVETITMDPNQTKDQKITSLDFGNPDKDNYVAQDFERKRDFDGTAVVNKVNAGIDMFTGFMGRLDAAKKEKEMYKNNFTSDNLYGVSTNKDRGDYVAYGQQTGMFRPDQTGQETAGRFAYGQVGGYMQDGGQQDQREILKKFMATPEFKKGLDLMMQRDTTDNADPFYDAMRDANYSEEDQAKYRSVIGSNEDWQNIVPQKSAYDKEGRAGEYQKIINNLYGSERYVTPYAPGGGGPRREDAPYYPVNEKIGPFEDGRLDPRTLDRPAGNYYTDDEPAPEGGYKHGGYMQSGGYTEGDEVDMTEEELAEFIANGGEVEYLES